MDNLFSVKDKVAVVTGSCGVLGGCMARGLAERGAKVVITGTRQEVCEQVASELAGEAFGFAADVTNKSDLEKLRDAVLAKWGRIDILVNAAGGNMPGATVPPEGSFFDVPIEAVSGVMNLNFIGTVLPCLVLGKDIAGHGGSIVNISSMAADQALTRVMGYSASKAAVSNFTRWLAVELAQKIGEGIRVNAIAPGFFLGEQNRSLLTNEDGSLTARGSVIVKQTPMGRFGEPQELVGTLLWLVSDASKFVTGTVIPVDGGFSAFSGV